MDKKTKRRLAIAGIALALLYPLSCWPWGKGSKSDSKMETAMRQTKELIADTRREIQREKDKSIFERILDALFNPEKKHFDEIKTRLPIIIKSAMPDFLQKRSNTTGFRNDDGASSPPPAAAIQAFPSGFSATGAS